MPPRYSSYDVAFRNFKNEYTEWREQLDSLDEWKVAFMADASTGSWLNAFSGVCSCINVIRGMFLNQFDMKQEHYLDNHFFSCFYFARRDLPPPDPVPITMATILSAMVTAEPSQIQDFVGLTDAYRQSLWNKPFNKEFFAALARGFEQWE